MATYIRLTDYKDSDSKEQGFFKDENRYEAKQSDFEKFLEVLLHIGVVVKLEVYLMKINLKIYQILRMGWGQLIIIYL